jgi:hypothetical protein
MADYTALRTTQQEDSLFWLRVTVELSAGGVQLEPCLTVETWRELASGKASRTLVDLSVAPSCFFADPFRKCGLDVLWVRCCAQADTEVAIRKRFRYQ